jgi:hypothetical protein
MQVSLSRFVIIIIENWVDIVVLDWKYARIVTVKHV